jgi:DNA replication protein DnaC
MADLYLINGKPMTELVNEYRSSILSYSDIHESFLKSNWDNYEITKENESNINFLKNIRMMDSFGAFIHGPAGSGKTHLMKCFLNDVIDFKVENFERYKLNLEQQAAINFGWINLSSWLQPRRTDNTSVEYSITRNDILFIDDLGVSNRTEWTIDQVYQLLNFRLESKKQTFITSNLTLDQIATNFHERIASRIKEMCIPVQLKGEDRRTKKIVENLKTVKERIEKVES